jgi:hypothetical protein
MPKQYALISGAPLTEFEDAVLKMLQQTAETDLVPRAMVCAILTDGGEIVTYYHKATMQDMMVAKGFIDLDIQNDNILGNLPWYLEQAEKDGLIEYDDEEEDEEDL